MTLSGYARNRPSPLRPHFEARPATNCMYGASNSYDAMNTSLRRHLSFRPCTPSSPAPGHQNGVVHQRHGVAHFYLNRTGSLTSFAGTAMPDNLGARNSAGSPTVSNGESIGSPPIDRSPHI